MSVIGSVVFAQYNRTGVSGHLYVSLSGLCGCQYTAAQRNPDLGCFRVVPTLSGGIVFTVCTGMLEILATSLRQMVSTTVVMPFGTLRRVQLEQ